MKFCSKCKTEKSPTAFNANANTKDGLGSWCRDCMQEYKVIYNRINKSKNNNKVKEIHSKYREADSLYDYKSNLMIKYGLTVEGVNEILDRQGGVCAICKKDDWGSKIDSKPCVDHCHNSNIIRGLLCATCNIMLGLIGDSVIILKNAINYLEEETELKSLTIEQRREIHKINGTKSIIPKVSNVRERKPLDLNLDI